MSKLAPLFSDSSRPTTQRIHGPIVLFTIAALFSGPVVCQPGDPLLGSWQLNVARSKYETGVAPKSDRRTYAFVGDQIHATAQLVDANGNAQTFTHVFAALQDGVDRPVTGIDTADTQATKRTGDLTWEITRKKAGKVTSSITRTMSKDGRTMTLEAKQPGADGVWRTNVLVYEKSP